MKKTKKAFSLIIAIGLVLISILLAFTIMEYIVPFLRNIRGTENSVNAYYFSYSGLEKGLYFLSNRPNEMSETGVLLLSDEMFGFSYKTTSSGTTLPLTGKGESEYDNKWGAISMGSPIQLSVGNGYLNENTNNLKITFRVPKLNPLDNTCLQPENVDLPYIINWQLSSSDDTLNSSTGSLVYFKAETINASTPVVVGNLVGVSVNDNIDKNPGNSLTTRGFSDFYKANCSVGRCILRFSVINVLKLDNSSGGGIAPYLERQLSSNLKLPLRYSIIESTGKSYGFQKSLQIKVPQDTVSEALDFAVFQ